MNDNLKPKVLVVEDEESCAMVISKLFEAGGAEVAVARDGPSAISAVTSPDCFDLIAVDIRMPGMKGTEVAETLRASGFKGGIVALTASATVLGKKAAAARGINHYFSKGALNKSLVAALLEEFGPKA